MRKAVYPGTFDPFHEGHNYVLNEALKIFDKVYILIANSSIKDSSDFKTRKDNILNHIGHKSNVEIMILDNKKLTGDVVRELGCIAVVRGVRNSKDLEYEMDMKKAYEVYFPEISYVTFLATDKNKNISSTLIREINKIKGE